MRHHIFMAILLAAASVCVAPFAHATANCSYGPQEFRIIDQGTSPDHRYSIRAHGDGEMGLDNFHVYLYSEPGHKRIGSLEEVKEVLDTCADAFNAAWSPDSRHVAVRWRHSHQDSSTVLYRIANRRAYPIKLPNVQEAVAHHLRVDGQVFPGGNEHTWGEWLNASNFQVALTCTGIAKKDERQLLRAPDYIDVDTNRVMAEEQKDDFVGVFTGVAIYEFSDDRKYRLISVRPSKDADAE